MTIEIQTAVESVRSQPTMYVGSRTLFGFINYLVCPFNLLLASGARQVTVSLEDGAIELTSDASLPVEFQPEDRLLPFEDFMSVRRGQGLDGPILTALSATLEVRANASGKQWHIRYANGARVMAASVETAESDSVALRFVPDASFFAVTSVSTAAIDSYLRRMCHLFPGVTFTLLADSERKTHYSELGIRDLFQSVSTAYQILHAPIHLSAEEGGLQLELVFAYHSWTENIVWAYVNRGRAVEGGTHEKGRWKGLVHGGLNPSVVCSRRRTKVLRCMACGLVSFGHEKLPAYLRRRVLDTLHQQWHLPYSQQKQKPYRNGVLAVLSIIYPQVVWEGCVKRRIASPELKNLVARLVVQEGMKWSVANPEATADLRQMETFTFPDMWYR